MLYANKNDEKIQPKPGARAECPACGGEVIAKCGSIYTWHWSHVAADCDPWSEPETEWHKGWKDRFPPECREVVIGPHRADVRTKSGIVIEFQHSPISAEEIIKRENFYGERMMWVIDGSSFVFNFWVLGDLDEEDQPFEWRWVRKSWWNSKRPKFICFGDKGIMIDFEEEHGLVKKDSAVFRGVSDLIYLKSLSNLSDKKSWSIPWGRRGKKGIAKSVKLSRFLRKYEARLDIAMDLFYREECGYSVYDEDDIEKIFSMPEDNFSEEEKQQVFNMIHGNVKIAS